MATRFQADRDLVVVSGALGSVLDPSPTSRQISPKGTITPIAHLMGISTKMGLDATRPLECEGHVFTKVRIPGEDKIDLDAEVDRNPKVSWRQVFSD